MTWEGIPVGLWMDPPLPVICTVLLRLPAPVEPEVGKVGTQLLLGEAGQGGVEAGPGVEDDRTVGSVIRSTGAEPGYHCRNIHDS